MTVSPRKTNVNLAVNLGGLAMKNPVTVASGTFAAGREYSDFVDVASLGAVTTKGVSLNGWEGNASPRIAETPSGMLNSIGLQNPGVAHLIEHDLPWLREVGATSIVNVSGHSFDEYVQVIEALEAADAADAYEINISFPNVDAGGMTIGTDPASVREVVGMCRAATRRPMIVKLTPNVCSNLWGLRTSLNLLSISSVSIFTPYKVHVKIYNHIHFYLNEARPDQ